MLTALILFGTFYFVGALISGKIFKSKMGWMRAILIGFVVLIVATSIFHFLTDVSPDRTSRISGIIAGSMVFGFRSTLFLPQDQSESKE